MLESLITKNQDKETIFIPIFQIHYTYSICNEKDGSQTLKKLFQIFSLFLLFW